MDYVRQNDSSLYTFERRVIKNFIAKERGVIKQNDMGKDNALKTRQCPNCFEPNRPDSQFCIKCRIVVKYNYQDKISTKFFWLSLSISFFLSILFIKGNSYFYYYDVHSNFFSVLFYDDFLNAPLSLFERIVFFYKEDNESNFYLSI